MYVGADKVFWYIFSNSIYCRYIAMLESFDNSIIYEEFGMKTWVSVLLFTSLFSYSKQAERLEASRESPARCQQRIAFLRQGEPATTTNRTPATKLLALGLKWKMEVDLRRQLCNLQHHPSSAGRSALLVELIVPWKEGLDAAHERKRAKYADLVAK